MVKIFQYNNANGNVELNTPEIILVKEFEALMKDERNITEQDKKVRLLESSLIYIQLQIGRVLMPTIQSRRGTSYLCKMQK